MEISSSIAKSSKSKSVGSAPERVDNSANRSFQKGFVAGIHFDRVSIPVNSEPDALE